MCPNPSSRPTAPTSSSATNAICSQQRTSVDYIPHLEGGKITLYPGGYDSNASAPNGWRIASQRARGAGGAARQAAGLSRVTRRAPAPPNRRAIAGSWRRMCMIEAVELIGVQLPRAAEAAGADRSCRSRLIFAVLRQVDSDDDRLCAALVATARQDDAGGCCRAS
jgi:hypothetical protein